MCVCLERAASRDAQRPLDHRVRGIEKGWSFALFKMPPNCNGPGMRAAGNRLGERVNAIKIRLKRLNRFGQSVYAVGGVGRNEWQTTVAVSQVI